MSQIPVTLDGKHKLQEELTALEHSVPKLQAAIKEARERGDLRENAEYHAAREELALTNAKIAELRDKLARAVVIDASQIDTSAIAFGATVTLKDLDDGSVEDWQLVGEGEDDALENKILCSSPMGQALLGHKQGDRIEVQAPMGTLSFKIQRIRY